MNATEETRKRGVKGEPSNSKSPSKMLALFIGSLVILAIVTLFSDSRFKDERKERKDEPKMEHYEVSL